MADAQRVAPRNGSPGPAREAAVVSMPAEIDITNAGAIGGQLAAAVPGGAVVIADMTATTFCDSAGIRMLVLAQERAAAAGAELRLVAPSGAVRRILALMGIDGLLPVYPSLAEALAATRK